MRECVEQFIEGRNAWRTGVLGFFLQLRGMIPTAIVTIFTMGTPFWWPTIFPQAFSIPTWVIFFYMAFMFGGSLAYIRWRSNRSLAIKASLHTFAHEIRDEQNNVYSIVLTDCQEKSSGNSIDLDKYLRSYCKRQSNNIRDYFRSQINDNTIEAGIRLAIESTDPHTTKIVFSTFGRSSGLNSKREETTEDIPSNEGIPRFMSDQWACQGILIYNDLEKAEKLGAFKMTKNDRSYSNEIRTMMVAPLNGWDSGGEKRAKIIGLLYITSKSEGVFVEKHVDAVRFVADTLAFSVAFTVQTLIKSGKTTQFKK